MDSVFSFVVGLLTAALSLLGFVQQHPELPQASRDQAQQVAQQAITQATQALTNTPRQTPLTATTQNTSGEAGKRYILSSQKTLPTTANLAATIDSVTVSPYPTFSGAVSGSMTNLLGMNLYQKVPSYHGYYSGNVNVSNGRWSASLETQLPAGTYFVDMYVLDGHSNFGSNNVVTTATLTVTDAPSNTASVGNKDYKGAWFKIAYPTNFVSKAEGTDEASFTSPDGSVQFYVYSPQWSGNPVSYLQALSTETVQSDTSTPDITSSTNSYGTTYSKKVIRYVTFVAKDGSYKRSFVSTTAGYVTAPDSEEYASKTHTVFGIKYQNQAAYDKYLNDYLAFKKSLVQYAD